VVPCCFDVSLSDFRERRMDSSSCLPIKDLFRSCAYIVLISLEEYRENGEEKLASERIHEVRDDASIRAKVFGESLARIRLRGRKPHNSPVFILKLHLVIPRKYTDLADLRVTKQKNLRRRSVTDMQVLLPDRFAIVL
ncbi:hypothetical protein ALC57_10753, partial [Trachymyrmex cornetzi]